MWGLTASMIFSLASLSAQVPLLEGSRKAATPADVWNTDRFVTIDVDGDRKLDLVRLGAGSCCFAGSAILRNRQGRFEALSGLPDVGLNGLGDFDGDGDVDALSWPNFYENDGRGGFRPRPSALTNNRRVVTGDVDGDGRIDFVDEGTLFRATGPFTFQGVAWIPPVRGIPELVDVDGDVDLDLIYLAYSPGSALRLMLNDATGHFTEATATHLPQIAYATHLATIDVDRDGAVDLVVAGRGAGLTLLLNDGTGRFRDASLRIQAVVADAVCVAGGDIDGDFDVDLVVGLATGGVVLEQQGGVWRARGPSPWPATQRAIAASVLFDVEGDGDLDLIASTYAGESSRVTWSMFETDLAYNDGRGNFSVSRVPPISLATAYGGVLGDLDGDGVVDLLVTENGGSLFLGDGRGGFGPALALNLPVDGKPALADLDADGDLDAVVSLGRDVHVLRNAGNARFTLTQTVVLPISPFAGAFDVAIIDFDRDGDLDVLAVVCVLSNDGTGRLACTTKFEVGGSMLVGDLDRDGDLDVVAGRVVYLNHAGVFKGTWLVLDNDANLALADLDGDGFLDLVAAGYSTPWSDGPPSFVHWNDGRGGFAARQQIAFRGQATAVAVFDVDLDGDLDVLLGKSWGRHLLGNQLVRNLGNRTFETAPMSEDADNSIAFAVADLDRDGDPDVVEFSATPSGAFASEFVHRILLGTVRHLASLDPAQTGHLHRLRLDGAPGGALLLLATRGASIPTPFGVLGIDPRALVLSATIPPPAAGGRTEASFVLPASAGLVGVELWWQALVAGAAPHGIRLTNTVRDVIAAY